jgi:hypothetical protein
MLTADINGLVKVRDAKTGEQLTSFKVRVPGMHIATFTDLQVTKVINIDHLEQAVRSHSRWPSATCVRTSVG